MRKFSPALLAFVLASVTLNGQAAIQLHARTNRVEAFSVLEFTITELPSYADPFDPAVVDLQIEILEPDGKHVVAPAYFGQDYEHRVIGGEGSSRDWAYPVGTGTWKARFAPSLAGNYRAAAVLIDARGTNRSAEIAFESEAANARGFVRVSRRDPRFFEFDNGEPFFPIGQNLAFIGAQQYVTPTKVSAIFDKLATNGANYLRVWTCAEDWALAIEARKSAWGRSWGNRGRIVPKPDGATGKCLAITARNATQEVSPSHAVALRPSTRYVVTGNMRTASNVVLRLEVHGMSAAKPLASTPPLAWTQFRHEFTTGSGDWWLGPMRFRLDGSGSAWLSDLSLKEADGGAELLWEADLDRLARGFFNPVDCEQLDRLVSAAQQRGIYLQLCMLTRDLYMNALTNAAGPAYDRAIADAKKFFRHAIARWGAFTSVAAWEYWNEMNPGLPTDRFYSELGEFFEQADPYHHLRTTSTWGPSAKDCRHAKLDVADVHFYLRPTDQPRLANEVEAVIERTRWLREQAPKKPAHLGEFGLADNQWRITDDMRRIPDLSDVHNALWASALSGASGTAMFWWWERIDQRNGYPTYRPLSHFIADVPWNGGEIRTADASCSDESVRVIGLRAGRNAWLWLFASDGAWAKVAVEKQVPAERRDLTLRWAAAPTPAVRVSWWNTRTGEVVTEQTERSDAGALRLRVPPFQRDIAARVTGE